MSKILYVGPSWAARSYDTPEGSELDYTNLAKELDLDVVNLSKPGIPISYILDVVLPSYNEAYDAIIWVYHEPIVSITTLHHYDQALAEKINPKLFFESENFWDLREDLNQYFLRKISSLNCPVAIIGAHSDIENCNYSNITVIHPSWQKFLAETCNVKLSIGWGAEIAHRLIMTEFQDLTPSYALVDAISNTFKSWHELELHRVFNWCHPNKKGNQLFAKEIGDSLKLWMHNV